MAPPRLDVEAAALDAVAHLVRAGAMGDAGRDGAPELEARFGAVDHASGFFVPGVSARFFHDAVAACEAWDGWAEVTPWVASTDFCYPVDDAFVRTSRTAVAGALPTVTHLAKRPVAKCQLRLEHAGEPDEPRALRVSLATETPKRAEELPPSVTPTLVRDKVRKSFAWGAFRWDFTRVCEGANRAAIEREAKERFEVEVECASLDVGGGDEEHVAHSLLMKLCDFIEAEVVAVRR